MLAVARSPLRSSRPSDERSKATVVATTTAAAMAAAATTATAMAATDDGRARAHSARSNPRAHAARRRFIVCWAALRPPLDDKRDVRLICARTRAHSRATSRRFSRTSLACFELPIVERSFVLVAKFRPTTFDRLCRAHIIGIQIAARPISCDQALARARVAAV